MKMDIHGNDPANQGEEEENPFEIMDGRVIDLQLFIFHSHDENEKPSDKGQESGEGPPNPSKNRNGFNASNHRTDEKPSMPENKQVEPDMENK
jgi:hypothetical protein